jgi:hypothetical protein
MHQWVRSIIRIEVVDAEVQTEVDLKRDRVKT